MLTATAIVLGLMCSATLGFIMGALMAGAKTDDELREDMNARRDVEDY